MDASISNEFSVLLRETAGLPPPNMPEKGVLALCVASEELIPPCSCKQTKWKIPLKFTLFLSLETSTQTCRFNIATPS